MSHAISLSEMVGRVPLKDQVFVGEVFASAEANYDDEAQEVVVTLDGHVSPEDPRNPMQHLRPDWLPSKETVRVHADVHERSDIAHYVFHSWVRRVTEALPRLA